MLHDALNISERPEAQRARYWRRLADGRIECELCPRLCKLHDGQHAPCIVRAREGDHLVLTSYGRASGFSIDPIEKKPLFHFLPGTPVLSFGTIGCNLACKFCQNWDLSRGRELERLTERASPEAIVRTAEKAHSTGIAFTYNDPVIAHEYLVDVAAAAQARGMRTVAVSAGYVEAEPRAEFYRFIDAVNIDLKAFSEGFYRRICGGRLKPVLETLLYLKRETTVWVEITNLLIPGLNDSDGEIDALTGWVAGTLGADVPIHFTAFEPDGEMGDRRGTPPESLARARERAIANGLHYAYTGNLRDRRGNTTFCPRCGTALIARDGYRILRWNLTPEGLCPDCGLALPGVFEALPGDWGARRRSVALEREDCC